MSPKNSSWQSISTFYLLIACLLVLSACRPFAFSSDASPTFSPSPGATLQLAPTAKPSIPATEIPEILRSDILEYEVQEGDSLSSISALFSISPQTLLWANYDQLFDNSDWLLAGMTLTILPADGLLHQVGGTDALINLANFFNTDSQLIVDWSGNQIDPQAPQIFAGQWLFIPKGERLSRWREMPDIPRDLADIDPVEFGNGACPEPYSNEIVSDGTFSSPILPLALRGETFSAWHAGLDIAISSGEIVHAAASGVVVFSGWSNLGYGNLMMLDHGNEDYSLYSGLGTVIAACGQSVENGDPIARAAITGFAAGPILHFEIRRNGKQADPLSLIPSQ